MLNKCINKIPISIKIIILIILCITILVAKSIFLMCFLSVFTLILVLVREESVKNYINVLKSCFISLIFFSLMYIMFLGNLYYLPLILYKLILIIILIKNFTLYITFDNLSSGIYKLLFPLQKFNLDLKRLSYNSTIDIFYLIYFFKSKYEIKNIQMNKTRKKAGLKYTLLSRMYYTVNEMHNLQRNLKLKFYEVKNEKMSLEGYASLFIFILLLIVVLIKEVIL